MTKYLISRLAWHYKGYWLPNAIFIVINLVCDLSLNCVFTDFDHFRFRRAYQFYDIGRMFSGFMASMGSGAGRYVMVLLILILSLYRVDKQSIPRWVTQFFNRNLDLINMKHNSFLKCYHCHNSPVLNTFALLMKNMKEETGWLICCFEIIHKMIIQEF